MRDRYSSAFQLERPLLTLKLPFSEQNRNGRIPPFYDIPLAAHSPTEHTALQTADIARRLMRGGELHQRAEGP